MAALLPHQQRVVDEKNELDHKIDKLNDFILSNDMFNSLQEKEQSLLKDQALTMRLYSNILEERIKLF